MAWGRYLIHDHVFCLPMELNFMEYRIVMYSIVECLLKYTEIIRCCFDGKRMQKVSKGISMIFNVFQINSDYFCIV